MPVRFQFFPDMHEMGSPLGDNESLYLRARSEENTQCMIFY